LQQNHQQVTTEVSPSLGTDPKIGQSTTEAKKHLRPTTTDAWLKVMLVDG
jgi:hypothetical protein